MLKRLALALILTALPPPGIAGQTPLPTRGPLREDVLNLTAVLKVSGMERVEVRADLVYETVGDVKLAADVYRPPDSKTAQPPVLVLVAGGAENPKDWGIYRSLGRLFAASGFVTVAFNHRLRFPRRQYEEGAEDLLALLGYLRRNGAALGLDPERVAVMTFSGGGPMLAVFLRERRPEVRCLAAFYSFLDTEHVDTAEAGTTPDVVRRFSPLLQLRAGLAGVPPLFIARGGRDEIPGVNASIDRFAAAALETNAPVTLVNHPEGSHGFEHRNDDDRSREILRMAIEFFHACL